MLFVTNRARKGSYRSQFGKPFVFDIQNNAPSNSVYFCRRDSDRTYVEIGGVNFMSELKASPYQQILFYIHGFSNLPEDHIFPRAQQLQNMFDARDKKLVQVIPLIWPCDNDFGVVKDYWDDQKSADQSAFSFSRVLQKFMEWRETEEQKSKKDTDFTVCMKRINIIAHSMGNRVLRETIHTWNRYDLPDGVPKIFRNTFLVAADIVNESLEYGKEGEHICHASRNVCVYFASDDLALRASKISNLKNRIASRRLGHSGPENIEKVPTNVFSIDCDNFNNTYDTPTGHTYFLNDEKGTPGRVFEHMYQCIKSGRVFPQDEYRRTVIL